MRKILFILFLFPVLLNAQIIRVNSFVRNQTTASTLINGITAFWKMDETSGTNLNDEIGTNDITLTESTVNQTGKIGKAVDFDGDNDLGTLAASPTSSLSEVSISMWIYPHSTTAANGIWNEDIDTYWQFTVSIGTWYTRDTGTGTTGGRNNDLSMPGLTQNAWNHLVFVYSVSDGYKRVYLNGSQQANNTTSIDQLNAPTLSRICTDGEGNFFNGLADNIIVWGRALSSTEVSELYTKENGGTTYPW